MSIHSCARVAVVVMLIVKVVTVLMALMAVTMYFFDNRVVSLVECQSVPHHGDSMILKATAMTKDDNNSNDITTTNNNTRTSFRA